MGSVLSSLQRQTGGWVGSSAVHLGDNDVPNALVWLDKYTQVPRILRPIIDMVSGLDELVRDAAPEHARARCVMPQTLRFPPSQVRDAPGVREYVEATFGSVDACRTVVLGDFFRHGFDGSGAHE